MHNKGLRLYIVALLSVTLVFFSMLFVLDLTKKSDAERNIKIGFVYIGDGSDDYTKNFIMAQHEAEKIYGSQITSIAKYNVPYDNIEDTLDDLVNQGCELIFNNSYGYSFTTKEFAKNHPNIQFCQATGDNANLSPVVENYHTFMGHIHEGRYLSGVVAGLKLQELINQGKITPSEAKVGFIGAHPYPEIISGYTAFYLGVRSIVPSASLTVRYTYTWTDFFLEKSTARKLIDEDDCIIISQLTDTIGPALACEETDVSKNIFYIGYNMSMSDIAPTTYITGTRSNWAPYISQAIKAVIEGKKIEEVVNARVNGNDSGAGFKQDWVRMLEVNEYTAAKGTKEKLTSLVESMKTGDIKIFFGNYKGTDPKDPEDKINLNTEYIECEKRSAPSFHYILDGIKVIN